MKKIKITAVLLLFAIMFSVFSIIACDDNVDDDGGGEDDNGDDFSGSIAAGDDDDNDDGGAEDEDEGDADAIYYISTAEELRKMKRKGTYILMADIDISDEEWKPLGTYASPFVGSFDGQGHTISGLNISSAVTDSGVCISYGYTYLGLFGCVNGASIKNVTLSDVSITVDSTAEFRTVYAGSVAGYANSSVFENCDISGKISVSSQYFKAVAGSIVGISYASEIRLCESSANVSTTRSALSSMVGGIVGHSGKSTLVYGCKVSGTLSAVSGDGNAYCGGVVAYLYNSGVEKCSSSASVSAKTDCDESELGKLGAAYAGGIAAFSGGTGGASDSEEKNDIDTDTDTDESSENGSASKVISSYIKNSFASGSVTSNSADYASYAGGIVATHNHSNISYSYSSATVYAYSGFSDVYVGGIAGYSGSNITCNGLFFAGTLKASATNDHAYSGVLIGYNGNTDKEAIKTDLTNCGYVEDMNITVNGKSYNLKNTIDDELFLIYGEDYTASELKTKKSIVGSFGWNEADWTFSMVAYPDVKLD